MLEKTKDKMFERLIRKIEEDYQERSNLDLLSLKIFTNNLNKKMEDIRRKYLFK